MKKKRLSILAIIPARYASTRFPGKPLAQIKGKPMIQCVYEQVLQSQYVSEVIVATDDNRIADAVTTFGGNVLLTAEHHQSGTDRCAEVIDTLKQQFDVALNVQGDEPFISPQAIDRLCQLFTDAKVEIGTLVKKITTDEVLFDSNKPKVIIDKKGKALYFSRQTIPFFRDEKKENWLNRHTYYHHIGVYGFRSDVLRKVASLPVSSLEKAEALEQLRWLENGFNIYTAETNYESFGIDTPEDLEKVQNHIK